MKRLAFFALAFVVVVVSLFYFHRQREEYVLPNVTGSPSEICPEGYVLACVSKSLEGIEEVIPFVGKDPSRKIFKVKDKEYLVKMNTDKYHVFKNNMKCVACGLEGTKMLLECHPCDMQPHFNLYGVENDKLVLFTKDHILARACGGEDRLDNYQTMCSICNNLKAHSNLTLDSVLKLRQIYNENKKKINKKKLHLMIEEERVKLEKPWPHLIYKSNVTEKPRGSVETICDLVMVEVNKEIIAIPVEKSQHNNFQKGYIQKNAYLEEIVEINNQVVCRLPDDTILKIDKSLLKN